MAIPFSYPVGVIPKQELKVFKKDGEEVFYKVDATFAEVPMEVIISSYLWDDDFFGKVRLKGYPYVYRDEDGHYILTWYAHSITPVDEDVTEENRVALSVRVTKREDITQSRNRVDMLRFVGTQRSFDSSVVIIYCVAKGALARKLNKLQVDDTFNGYGEITMHRGYRNVIIDEIGLEKE